MLLPLIEPGVKYELVIIEEPEINLHPDMHVSVADFIASLVRYHKVLITTHSHYVLAELGNLYMAGQLGKLNAYLIDEDGLIKKLEVGKEGVELPKTIERALSILAERALKVAESLERDH